MRFPTAQIVFALLTTMLVCAARAADAPKPKVAVFPLAGDADAATREKVGFSLRAKLDRDGAYESISGVEMKEMVEGRDAPVALATPLKELQQLARDDKPEVFIWGELNRAAGGTSVLKVKVFDVMQPDPLPRVIEQKIELPTDLRFASEAVLQALADVKAFEHPDESATHNDADADRLWKENPNLIANGDFSQPPRAGEAGEWDGLLMAEKYPAPVSETPPDVDKVVVYRMPVREGAAPDVAGMNNVLAMNLSQYVAENNGLACLSGAIKIEANTRYRFRCRYKSDGPIAKIFIKGYTVGKNIAGEPADREIYRRQVPEGAETHGEWKTIECDLNPQHVAFPVQFLKVDLYAYLKPGSVMFDDVELKSVGVQTHIAHDEAYKKPLSGLNAPAATKP